MKQSCVVNRRQSLSRHLLYALVAAALASVTAQPARATLGGTPDSVAADQGRMRATMHSTRMRQFTVHELVGPNRVDVREYVGPSGLVFAIAWQGPLQPDLRQLLGPRFALYVDAVEKRRARRAPVTVVLPDAVVQSGGHMRAFAGKAWLPAELPSGVSAADIR